MSAALNILELQYILDILIYISYVMTHLYRITTRRDNRINKKIKTLFITACVYVLIIIIIFLYNVHTLYMGVCA
jgi:hypothetical protein